VIRNKMEVLLIAIPFAWLGMLGAISFLEAPLKFRAPNITRELALGIGKLVFRALNRVELVLAAVMLICMIATRLSTRNIQLLFGATAAILIVQTVWLLPSLSARATAVIAGEEVPNSRLHLVFVVCETVKILLLAVVGVMLLSEFKV
ncbi:MAG TPA: DUF4149 domain-containing protein, partial [Pyrinomonadaceae bacterium]|nr:DUF4149 domain-containing protein [Pyrinomonadaceae bacterium]